MAAPTVFNNMSNEEFTAHCQGYGPRKGITKTMKDANTLIVIQNYEKTRKPSQRMLSFANHEVARMEKAGETQRRLRAKLDRLTQTRLKTESSELSHPTESE